MGIRTCGRKTVLYAADAIKLPCGNRFSFFSNSLKKNKGNPNSQIEELGGSSPACSSFLKSPFPKAIQGKHSIDLPVFCLIIAPDVPITRRRRAHQQKALMTGEDALHCRCAPRGHTRMSPRASGKRILLRAKKLFPLTALDLKLACKQRQEGPGIGYDTDCLRGAPVHQFGQVGRVDIDTDRFYV
jgi:hypothetical protein